jgi:predicted MFS family arabinose efflux permease
MRVRYTTFVLFLVTAFNLMDRQILAILLEPIKRDLQLSDTAMGLLTGFAFVALYAIASIPIARLADATSRRAIIASALAFWSAMTALSACAGSFAQLALARAGVGFAESATGPASNSMIADLYPPQRRAFAMSMLATASPFGVMLAFVAGGALNDAVGWRMTLICAGLPGIVLALVVWLTVREPERGGAESGPADTTRYDFRPTLRYLSQSQSFVYLTLGAAASIFAIMAMIVWSPSVLTRIHGVPTATAGLSLGIATGFGGLIGAPLSGWLASRLSRRDVRWLLRLPAVTSVLAAPCLALFLLLPPVAALPFFFLAVVCCSAMLGPVMTAAQDIAKVRMRATASALMILTFNFIGTGLGPVAVGALSDLLADSLGSSSIRAALGLAVAASVIAGALFHLGARDLRADVARAACPMTAS